MNRLPAGGTKAAAQTKAIPRSNAKTRQILLDFLRAGPVSIGDLARLSGLTVNAVRFHLTGLQADGLVAVVGRRRQPGAGKPALLYMVTPNADASFSKAYAPVLSALLQELRNSVPASQVVRLLCGVGARLGAGARPAKGPLKRRVQAGADILCSLGGLVEVARTRHGYEIIGKGCPLGAAVSAEPRVCASVESLLCAITGARVVSRCEHFGRPCCRFEVSAA